MALDHYRILGIQPNATLEDIKRAYYRLAKEYHPDKNIGDANAEVKFMEIKEAYNTLLVEFGDGYSQAKEASVSNSPVKKKANISELSKQSDAQETMQQYSMYYAILNLQPGALANDIQASYYKLLHEVRQNAGLDESEKESQLYKIEYAYRMLMGKDDQDDAEDW